MSSNNTDNNLPSSHYTDDQNIPTTSNGRRDVLLASQIDGPPLMPGQTPPSTAEPLFSSSMVAGALPILSSHLDLPASNTGYVVCLFHFLIRL